MLYAAHPATYSRPVCQRIRRRLQIGPDHPLQGVTGPYSFVDLPFCI
jgi:hypothetical protein